MWFFSVTNHIARICSSMKMRNRFFRLYEKREFSTHLSFRLCVAFFVSVHQPFPHRKMSYTTYTHIHNRVDWPLKRASSLTIFLFQHTLYLYLSAYVQLCVVCFFFATENAKYHMQYRENSAYIYSRFVIYCHRYYMHIDLYAYIHI